MADRFPRFVYRHGTEPDPRFSLANERTFLAWIRTSLALVAGGVALGAFQLPLPDGVRQAVAAVMLGAAIVLPGPAWWHWARAERAMRRGEPLPANPALFLLAGVVIACAVALLAGGLGAS